MCIGEVRRKSTIPGRPLFAFAALCPRALACWCIAASLQGCGFGFDASKPAADAAQKPAIPEEIQDATISL